MLMFILTEMWVLLVKNIDRDINGKMRCEDIRGNGKDGMR